MKRTYGKHKLMINKKTITGDRDILIHAPSIRADSSGNCFFEVQFKHKGIQHSLWFSVETTYAAYLTPERADAFLVALLPWAMQNGLNLHFVAPISQRLHFTVTHFLIPTLQSICPQWEKIHIEAPCPLAPLACAGACGTGLSCGVDSLTTVRDYLLNAETLAPPYRLTHFTFFNVGSHGYGAKCTNASVHALFQKRLVNSRACAKQLGRPLVVVNSNLKDYLAVPFTAVVTLCNCAAVLALQKLFTVYYVSSSVDLSKLATDGVIEHVDPIVVSLLGTETLNFFSTGLCETRIQKTEHLALWPFAQQVLTVCAVRAHNCSRCIKCLRTLLTLDLSGHLREFNNVFDIESFINHRGRLWAQARVIYGTDLLTREVFAERKRRHFHLPLSYCFWLGYEAICFFPKKIRYWIKRQKHNQNAQKNMNAHTRTESYASQIG